MFSFFFFDSTICSRSMTTIFFCFLMNSVVCSSSRVRGISKWFCVDYFSSRFIFLFWCGHALKNFVKLKFQKILRALPFEFYRINNSHQMMIIIIFFGYIIISVSGSQESSVQQLFFFREIDFANHHTLSSGGRLTLTHCINQQ